MKLNELITDDCLQYILSFSNDNDIFVHPSDLNPNSKFFRTSKVRLGVDFEFVGYIYNGSINKQATDTCSMVYRTKRGQGKCDYVLYVNQDRELLVHHIRSVKHSKVTEYRQQTINTLLPPDPDRIMHIYPALDSITFKGNMLKCDYTSHISVSTGSYYGMWESILVALRTVYKDKDKFNEVQVHLPRDKYTSQIIAYIQGKSTNNSRNRYYLSEIYKYRDLDIKFLYI